MLYSDNDPYKSDTYRQSRLSYTLECSFEYFVSLLVTDSFLALLLTSMGFSETLTGIISSVISLAFLFEFLSVFVIRKITNTKLFVIVFHSVSQLFFLGLYLVPFIRAFDNCRPAVILICITTAYFGNYFVTSVIYRWGNSYVNPKSRAIFSSTKEMISLISGIFVTVGAGYVMKSFVDADNINSWFVFAALSILIFSICDFICLLLIKNDVLPSDKKPVSVPLRTVFTETICKKSFINIVILESLWRIACYSSVGFLGSYKNFLFSVSAVQIINAAANLIRFALSRSFGRFSDKYSYSKGILLGMSIAACAFAVNIFTDPSTRWLIIVFTVLYNLSIAGISQNMINLSYNFVDKKYFAEATAIKSSISGIFGFTASLFAGRLLDCIQSNGNSLFGIPMYGQQALSAISLLFMTAAIIFNAAVVGKQKVLSR